MAGIVLTDACQTGTPWCRYLCPHLGAAEPAAPTIDPDAPVDDGDEVRVSHEVHGRPRPGAIDATEEHVTVQRSLKPFWLNDAQLEPAHPELTCCCALPEASGERVDFGSRESNVTTRGVELSV